MRAILHKIHELLNRDWSIQLSHVLLTGNMVADYLAKLGAKAGQGLFVWHSPPVDLLGVLSHDVTT